MFVYVQLIGLRHSDNNTGLETIREQFLQSDDALRVYTGLQSFEVLSSEAHYFSRIYYCASKILT